ncbi:MAG: hypothetical protein ACE5HC_15400, partial [Candidatus Binatia bacterium]
ERSRGTSLERASQLVKELFSALIPPRGIKQLVSAPRTKTARQALSPPGHLPSYPHPTAKSSAPAPRSGR